MYVRFRVLHCTLSIILSMPSIDHITPEAQSKFVDWSKGKHKPRKTNFTHFNLTSIIIIATPLPIFSIMIWSTLFNICPLCVCERGRESVLQCLYVIARLYALNKWAIFGVVVVQCGSCFQHYIMPYLGGGRVCCHNEIRLCPRVIWRCDYLMYWISA